MPDALFLALYAAAGLAFGSFGGVLAYRIPRRMDFVKGRSLCESCGAELKSRDLIPVFSFLLLRGRCRFCKAPIPRKSLWMELTSGLLAALCFPRFGLAPEALTGFFFLFVMLVITAVDLESLVIPDQLSLALLVSVTAHYALSPEGAGLSSRVTGVFILSVPMFLSALVIKDSFGGGDMKLSAICGFLLGVRQTLLMGFIAAFLGGLAGVYVKYIKKSGDSRMAFAPWLCAGAAASFLAGGRLIEWYLSLFNM